MKRVIFFLSALLAGCAPVQQTETSADQPELISTAPIPLLGTLVPPGGVRIDALLHVSENGTVGEARLLGSSNQPQWDSLVLRSLLQWRFAPPVCDGVPTDQWIRRSLLIQAQEPVMRYLSELVCATRQEADSLYLLIAEGIPFDSLARNRIPSAAAQGALLGPVNIAVFPPHVRVALKDLKEDEVTSPLRVGGNYAIYKRLREDPPELPRRNGV